MYILTLKNSAFRIHLGKCRSTDFFNLFYTVTHNPCTNFLIPSYVTRLVR